ncbi:MAG: nucleotide-binding protein [Gemmataceae bacterium]|nr:nucleotide-binding protein [Gemmataceae bacterium]
MSLNALGLVKQRRQEIANLEPLRSNWPKFVEWHTRSRALIAHSFPKMLDKYDELLQVRWCALPRVIGPMTSQSELDRITHTESIANDKLTREAREKMIAFVDSLVELATLTAGTSRGDPELTQSGRAKDLSGKVFVVHGHDDEMKQHVARVLSKLGLTPIILHEQPNFGKTIIEKFESTADVSFAVVLLSPDDMAYPLEANAKQAKSRARQNVILELGYFVGKLGRSQVFSLKRGSSIELPSDFSGVVYTDYDAAGHWRFTLVRELKAAGYAVDANNLL